jgi:hypothetical protein
VSITPTFTLGQAQSLLRAVDADLARRRDAASSTIGAGADGGQVALEELEDARAILDETLQGHPEP